VDNTAVRGDVTVPVTLICLTMAPVRDGFDLHRYLGGSDNRQEHQEKCSGGAMMN
jgi:hypothetical protein